MATLSIRGLDDKTAKILKDYARRGGMSVNLQVVELIRKGLGLAAPTAGVHAHTDLDHLAGTWSAKEAREFAQRTQAFETVDEELWR
jgi:plasmid stability protein